MDIVHGSALPPPSDALVREVEDDNGVALPADFVAFLKRANGAKFDMTVFPDGKRERLIERMLCLVDDYADDDANGPYDIRVVLAQIGERLTDDGDRRGSNVIPVAALFAGDFVCLDYRNSAAPSIAVWDHERSDEFAPVLDTVAPSFSQFEGMLRKSNA